MHLPTLRYRKYNRDAVMAHRVVWWGLVGRLISFGVNCAWMEFCLYGIAWKNMMEMGRGGAYVPTRVALQGRIHRSFPAHNACIFWYGNAAVRTFGRAHRHRPYGFVWVDFVWMVDFVWGGLCLGGFVCWLVKTVHMNQHHRCCTFVSPGLIERSEIYPG